MVSGARHKVQRLRRKKLKADCVVLLDRLVANNDFTERQLVEIAEMRMRLQPPTGCMAPVIFTNYTERK